jgi:sensor histidine kinase YesM
MMQGGIIIIGLYYLIMFGFYQRKSPVLIFSLLCFTMALLIFVESYRDLYNYSYQWHWYRMLFVLGLSAMVSVLLITFCMKRFEMPRLAPLIIITTALMAWLSTLDVGFDYRSYFVFAIGLVCSISIVTIARWQRKVDSGLTLLGLVITAALMLLLPYQFMDQYLFLSFGLLTLFILASLTLSLRKQQHEHNAALMNSSRLEIELLKKNIQPHFILNTLTAIEEWIEESPATAIKFIDALADEFRTMSKMAHQKLVPIEQELELCRSHLKIMSYRKNIDFRLNTVIEHTADMPPAILHTLIENAITHNNYRQGIVEFKLRQRISDQHLYFVFSSPWIARKVTPPKESQTRGTGLQYIRARLEESFAECWILEETQSSDEWVTTIRIPVSISSNSVSTLNHA